MIPTESSTELTMVSLEAFGAPTRRKKKAPVRTPPQPVAMELGRYLNRNNIRGADREEALGMMDALLGTGFHLIDAFPMWVCYDSERERISSRTCSLK